ncbi:MAG: hypothetical protein GAK32_01796 [Pseudomonas fluorescens]|nr:MAG: hypothetical protein GAK32_01796 [Pseudomonas fluorescens]
MSVPALVGVLVILQLAVFWAWGRLQADIGRRLVALSLIALAAQWLVLVKVVEPAKDLQFDTQRFVSAVETLRAGNPGPLVFVNLGKDTWAIRYIMNLDHDEKPLFISARERGRLDSLPRPAWVIVPRKETDLLQGTALEPLEPVFNGRLNDNPLLVFLVK